MLASGCDSSSDGSSTTAAGGSGGATGGTTVTGGSGGAGAGAGLAGGGGSGGTGGEAAPGELIWKYDAGDLDKASYDTYLASMPLGPAGRPQPDSNQYMLALPTSPWHFAFGIHYEVPTMEADLRIRAAMPADAQNQHSMFRGRNADKLIAGYYTRMGQGYKFEFEADFSAASSWQDVPWCIVFQIWGANYPTSWSQQQHPRNPPIAVSLDQAQFEIRVYGEHAEDLDSVAANASWTHADSANWSYSPGKHWFELWVTSDYRLPAEGGVGSVRLAMDGTTVYDNPAVVNAIHSQIDGQDAGGFPMFGVYSYAQLPAPTHPDVIFDRVKIYELP